MKKLLFSVLVITLALPALGGNKIGKPWNCNLTDDCIGAGDACPDCPATLTLCVGESCGVGDELSWDPAQECLVCCVGPDCGPIVPCVPGDCETGDLLLWDEPGLCFICCDPLVEGECPTAGQFPLCPGEECIDGDELLYNAALDCWDCCAGPGCGQVDPCDPLDCEEGDYLQFDAVLDCWTCVPLPGPTDPTSRRFLYRDASDTFTPSFWMVGGDQGTATHGMYLTAGDNWLLGPVLEPGASLFLSSHTYNSTLGGEAFLHAYRSWLDLRASAGTDGGAGATELFLQFGADSTFDVYTAGQLLNFGTLGVAETGIDLGAITHDDVADQGLRLPQQQAAGFVEMTTADEGWVGWATDWEAPFCNTGGTWRRCIPLLDPGVDGDSAAVNSPSGMSYLANTGDGSTAWLTLLRGCADTEVLAWDETNDYWECAPAGGVLSFSTIAGDSGTDPVADSGADTLTIAGGQGVATIGSAAADSITIHVDIVVVADGTGANSSVSGLETTQGATNDQLALLQGCADDEVLRWDEGTSVWGCSPSSQTLVVEQTIRAGQFDTLEPAFASLITKSATVITRARAFDPDADEYVNYDVHVPANLAATGNVDFTLWTTGDGTIDGAGVDVVWQLSYVGRDDGESFDAGYTLDEWAAETMLTTDATTLSELTNSVAVASFTAGDWLPIRVMRFGTKGSDTYDGDAHLIQMVITWPVE